MAKEKYEETSQDASNKDAAIKPDAETLNTTDPQEHMDGPISSLVKGVEESFSKKDNKNESGE